MGFLASKDRAELLEEYWRAAEGIDAFNREIAIWQRKLDAAWEGKRLREYLWLRQGEVRTDVLRRHFGVTSQKLAHTFAWLRRWGWRVEVTYRTRYWVQVKLIHPPNYRERMPSLGEIAPSKRKPPKPKREPKRRLTVDEITSLQARGYSLGGIARKFNLHPSTPCQILRRARLREAAE